MKSYEKLMTAVSAGIEQKQNRLGLSDRALSQLLAINRKSLVALKAGSDSSTIAALIAALRWLDAEQGCAKEVSIAVMREEHDTAFARTNTVVPRNVRRVDESKPASVMAGAFEFS